MPITYVFRVKVGNNPADDADGWVNLEADSAVDAARAAAATETAHTGARCKVYVRAMTARKTLHTITFRAIAGSWVRDSWEVSND